MNKIFIRTIPLILAKKLRERKIKRILFLIIGLMILLASIPMLIDMFTENNMRPETSGASGLRTLLRAEAAWYVQDSDRNNKKDYWTYDISAFYRIYRADGKTLVQAIDIAFAKADGNLHFDDIFGEDYTQDWSGIISPCGKSGYRFQSMLRDGNGEPYNQNKVNGVKATNEEKFAFVAYPDLYPDTGIRTYIVNQDGIIYSIDTGSDVNKIVIQWPGPGNPTEIKGPGGNYWRVPD